MLYTTFIALCDESVKHDDPQVFIMSLGWQSWMSESDVDGDVKDLSLIFALSRLDFPALRQRIGLSMRNFSAFYHVPLRTVENWESNSGSNFRRPAPYIVDLIRYTIFIRETEGDDGYIGYLV